MAVEAMLEEERDLERLLREAREANLALTEALNRAQILSASSKSGCKDCSLEIEAAEEDLLEQTRQMAHAVQARAEGEPLDYASLAKLLSGFLTANAYIIDKGGRVLGYHWRPEYESHVLGASIENGKMPEVYVERMNRCRDTEVHDEDAYLCDDEYEGERPEKHLMYVPIFGASAERLGTVLVARFLKPFLVTDILLAEYLGALVGIEVLHERSRTVEERARDRVAVQMAMRALSYSEVESMRHIMSEIQGFEGVAIASKVADRVGVTRSVIVNALRKLESAGLLESRSLGMKGTYIKVLSPLFLEELGVKHQFEEALMP